MSGGECVAHIVSVVLLCREGGERQTETEKETEKEAERVCED